jgi:hypothetical protein
MGGRSVSFAEISIEASLQLLLPAPRKTFPAARRNIPCSEF